MKAFAAFAALFSVSVFAAHAVAGEPSPPPKELPAGESRPAPTEPFDVKDAAAWALIVDPAERIQKLATDMKFTEGAVWVPEGDGYLIFSDIPSNELKKWSAKDGLSTFRTPSNNTNGNYLTLDGKLLCCEHGSRSVTMTKIADKDAKPETLVDSFEGKKLNSPNDVIVKSDGTLYFTDPPYGLKKGDTQEQAKQNVLHYDPTSKKLTAIIDDCDRPNGLCLSPDEKRLYVADSGKPKHIRVFDVKPDGTVTNGRVFCTLDKGAPDGIRADAEGRIYSSAGDGVQVFDTEGKLIGKILVPESPANVCFGGADRKTLFMPSRKSLYAIKLKVAGAQKP